jgi:hypothetical protein
MKKILLTTSIISLIISAVPATGQTNDDMSDQSEAVVSTVGGVEGSMFHKKQPHLDESGAYTNAEKFGLAHHLKGRLLKIYRANFVEAYLGF